MKTLLNRSRNFLALGALCLGLVCFAPVAAEAAGGIKITIGTPRYGSYGRVYYPRYGRRGYPDVRYTTPRYHVYPYPRHTPSYPVYPGYHGVYRSYGGHGVHIHRHIIRTR